MTKNKYKSDGGYGNTGNMTIYSILKELPLDREKKYRKYLKNNDKEKYEEYQEWEKLLD